MMEPSFEKLLVLLAERGVRFIVVGGVAVTLQGYVRLTEDVDLLVEPTVANIQMLLATLSGWGDGFASGLTPADFDDSEGAIRIVEEAEQCQVDLFTRLSGRRYSDVLLDADTLILQGHAIRYASKFSLIGWKGVSIREKDRLDAMALRELMENPNAFD
jgi:predicted nucleotidyltransferase